MSTAFECPLKLPGCWEYIQASQTSRAFPPLTKGGNKPPATGRIKALMLCHCGACIQAISKACPASLRGRLVDNNYQQLITYIISFVYNISKLHVKMQGEDCGRRKATHHRLLYHVVSCCIILRHTASVKVPQAESTVHTTNHQSIARHVGLRRK